MMDRRLRLSDASVARRGPSAGDGGERPALSSRSGVPATAGSL